MNPDIFLTIFQIVVMSLVLVGTIRIIGREKQFLTAVLFAFAMASFLLSDLYWLVYGIMRPEARMPFAANEISEWAIFLLLGASLTARCPIRFQSAKWEIAGACLFSAANAALWIAWSGEWVQDILTCLSYGYFLCCVVFRARQDDAFPPYQWHLAGALCLVLIAAQAAIFFVPEPGSTVLDLFCYALLFVVQVFLLVRAVLSLRRGESPEKCACHTFAAFAWSIISMYMSSGGFYLGALFLSTLSFPLMYTALKKEVEAA